MKILVIEDDPTVGEFVRRGLEEQRWQVDLVTDGREGESLALSQPYDLVVLDMRLPGKHGLDVLRTLRARSFERPVLVLTAQDAVDAKVETLRAGADDYVTKPFSPRELVSRVKANLRRARVVPVQEDPIRVADVEVDPAARTVTRAGEDVPLTYSEFEILLKLMKSPRRVFTREELMDHLWDGSFYGDLRSVDVHVRHLRQKVERDPANPVLIRTVRGVGYALGREDGPAE